MAHRVEAGRLLDDDDVLIEVAEVQVLLRTRWGERSGEQLEALALLEPASGVEAEVAADTDAPCLDDTADLGP